MVTALKASIELRRGGLALRLALEVADGEVVALLGPNGAGKTTALRALAGLLDIERGSVRIGGALVADPAAGAAVPVHGRRVGLVFQDYLLFPHLTVLDNVAFGLRARGERRTLARRLATDWLARFDIADLARLRPAALSGGQAQRVALVRALAPEPRLLLLDEPLAALDARTRLLVRAELRRRLAGFGGGTVLVTHDPIDAAVLADRMVVIESGQVVQCGTPLEVARRPRTDYVARLVGLNLLAGSASGHQVETADGGVVHLAESAAGQVHVTFRPAAVSLFLQPPAGSPRNVWPGRIATVEPHGERVRVEVAGAPGPASSVLADVTVAALSELGLQPGSPVWASVKASDVEVYARAQQPPS